MLEAVAILAPMGLAMAAGCAVVAVCLSAGGSWAGKGGVARIASSILLCLLSYGALLAIALRAALLSILVGVWGYDSPSTTGLDRFLWQAVPVLTLAVASGRGLGGGLALGTTLGTPCLLSGGVYARRARMVGLGGALALTMAVASPA